MSTPTSNNPPNEGHPNGVPPVRFDASEIAVIKGLLGRAILAGEWLLVQRIAAVLHYAHGVPASANVPDLNDMLNATRATPAFGAPPNVARFPRRTYGRTAGDTPEGENPHPDGKVPAPEGWVHHPPGEQPYH